MSEEIHAITQAFFGDNYEVATKRIVIWMR